MAEPTVHEVWRLALPTGTTLLGGDGGLGRQVHWARRMSVQPPAFANIEEPDIALISMTALTMVDERLTIDKAIEALSECKASAVVVAGEARPQAQTLQTPSRCLC